MKLYLSTIALKPSGLVVINDYEYEATETQTSFSYKNNSDKQKFLKKDKLGVIDSISNNTLPGFITYKVYYLENKDFYRRELEGTFRDRISKIREALDRYEKGLESFKIN